MANLSNETNDCGTPWWQPVLYASLAGGMAWGIRGQYGHETGAMIAGLLVSLTLVLLLCPRASSISLARAVAWGTLAMGIGGSMTYGQTVGLTHDSPLHGDWAALGWGMLGLAIKGGIWIGFAGAFLGMGLSEVRYRAKEILLLMLLLIGVYFLGVYLINSPMDVANKVLPTIYFSDDWYWEPEGSFTPRNECWGGLLFALTTLIVYTGWVRKDRLARNLAMWGVLGGALGFPIGQSIQAFSAWNREMLSQTFVAKLQLNWWNVMETVYGLVMGAVLGLGAWQNRRLMNPPADEEESNFPLPLELLLLALHIPMLLAVDLLAVPAVDFFYDLGLIMVVIPIVASVGGRWWPYLQPLPIVILPIAAKTLQAVGYNETGEPVAIRWLGYGLLPILLALALAIWAGQNSRRRGEGISFLRTSLLLTGWVFFWLNYGFFEYPWPWLPWGGRTANGLFFAVCACGLTALVLWKRKRRLAES